LDQAFDEGSVVRSNNLGYYTRIALQTDEKIMSIGGSSKVHRWTSIGKPDASFSIGGEVIGLVGSYFRDVAVTVEGKS
jgi:hypothetical protein